MNKVFKDRLFGLNEEDIKNSSKTVNVLLEIKGHKHVITLDGSNGLLVMVKADEGIQMSCAAPESTLAIFAAALLELMPKDLSKKVIIGHILKSGSHE